MQQRWVRFEQAGKVGFGTLHGERVHVHAGDMFGPNDATGVVHALADVRLLAPTVPTKVIALWNNFHALAKKLSLADPAEPLYLLKAPNSWSAHGAAIRAPHRPGKVVFEGELGIVIGRTCSAIGEEDALARVFGYTCANDVTAAEILNRDASFTQWDRAKGLDTFPATLTVTTRLDGEVRQHYPISDMRFSVARLVSAISFDLTLFAGDVILCGTSVGVGSMRPGSVVEVEIDGIGTLSNVYGEASATHSTSERAS
jgi:2-keto-4-pentenoate hydratase/2-oxohepta-3-ene-1,7-dioic acid hydratase in catechol pathway